MKILLSADTMEYFYSDIIMFMYFLQKVSSKSCQNFVLLSNWLSTISYCMCVLEVFTAFLIVIGAFFFVLWCVDYIVPVFLSL